MIQIVFEGFIANIPVIYLVILGIVYILKGQKFSIGFKNGKTSFKIKADKNHSPKLK